MSCAYTVLIDFHVAPMCTPTRGQLLTGLHCLKNGAMNVSSGRTLLRRGIPTLADLLAGRGYRTGLFGKWHLGGPPNHLPPKRGFDEFYGTVANTPFFNPPNFVDSRVGPDKFAVNDDSFYTTDAYRERGFWKLCSRIFPENVASLTLHARAGFRVVGVYRRHGKLGDEWRDCVIVEKLL